jgi:predicted AAA+ superfamily ATPase
MREAIDRTKAIEAITWRFTFAPVVAILGARQVGKSTLARAFAERSKETVHYFDLERPQDQRRLGDEWTAIEDLTGLIVLDEVQRRPDIFPMLRVLADRPGPPAKFLVLGSATPHLLRQGSESLAGRIAYFQLGGFDVEEAGVEHLDSLWLRGGFPRSFLSADDAASFAWRLNFVRTYVERDLPELRPHVATSSIDRFWRMLAHRHGQVWNAAEFARNFGLSAQTVRRYLDLLTDTFVVRQLRPWHENLGKRQVKSPKVYVADCGLLHALLEIETRLALERHPTIGASWEWFAMDSVIRRLGARPEQCYFWSTHASAELDLLVVKGSTRLGFEIKRTTAPSITPSMRIALKDLKLDRLDVIHAGRETWKMGERLRAVALKRVLEDVERL